MLRKVKLYGELADKYGKDWELDINSPGEAFQALAANNAGFRQFVGGSEQRGVGYKVMVGKSYLKDYPELVNPLGRQELKIIPVVLGAKNKGLTMVLIGAAILTGFWIYGQQYLAMGGGEAMGIVDGISVGIQQAGTLGTLGAQFGGALVLGGIASMMAPTPSPLAGEKAQNYAFNGAANTTRQGVAIPVCYGQLMVGGAVISSGISPEDYVPEPESDDE